METPEVERPRGFFFGRSVWCDAPHQQGLKNNEEVAELDDSLYRKCVDLRFGHSL